MKITFSWEKWDNRIQPTCTSDILNKDNVSIISCLLTDDGGVPFLHSLSWIDEGIKILEEVSTKKVYEI